MPTQQVYRYHLEKLELADFNGDLVILLAELKYS